MNINGINTTALERKYQELEKKLLQGNIDLDKLLETVQKTSSVISQQEGSTEKAITREANQEAHKVNVKYQSTYNTYDVILLTGIEFAAGSISKKNGEYYMQMAGAARQIDQSRLQAQQTGHRFTEQELKSVLDQLRQSASTCNQQALEAIRKTDEAANARMGLLRSILA